MASTLKIKGLVVGTALLCGLNQAAFAESTQLAEVETELDAQKVTIELWGDRLNNGYADQLMVFVKGENDQLLKTYKPTISGGYNCYLDTIQLKEGNPQLFLAVGQGDWRTPSAFRIVDFDKSRQAKELFSSDDSRGLVDKAAWQGEKLEIVLKDGKSNQVAVNPGILEKLSPRKRAPEYTGLTSVTAYDLDEDGKDELITLQTITSEGQLLADVGGVWKLEESGWQTGAYTIMLASDGKDNSINNGADELGYTVLPRKMLLGGGEATYPLIICPERWELQGKVNELLQAKTKDILEDFYGGKADTAFNVVLSTDKMLSLQLISGKTSFIHRHVHLDMQEGKEIKLGDIFDVQNPDFIALLNLLNGNKKLHFTSELPEEWYIQGDKFFLIQIDGDKEEVAGFALGNFHSFLLPQPWFHKNTD